MADSFYAKHLRERTKLVKLYHLTLPSPNFYNSFLDLLLYNQRFCCHVCKILSEISSLLRLTGTEGLT